MIARIAKCRPPLEFQRLRFPLVRIGGYAARLFCTGLIHMTESSGGMTIQRGELQDFTHFLRLKFNAEVVLSIGSEECLRAYIDETMLFVRDGGETALTVQCYDSETLERVSTAWQKLGVE